MKTTKGFLYILLCLAFLPAIPARAAETFNTGYACSDIEGRQRWTAITDIVRTPGKGIDNYLLIEKGAGILSGFKNKISWEARLEFESTKEFVRPIFMENKVFDDNGAMIFTEKEEFDHKTGKVRYASKDLLRNKTRNAEFNFKGDVANRLILGLYIQKFLENGLEECRLTLLSGEPRLYAVKLKVMGQEDIVINGVKKSAFKICLDPELGILNFVKVVIPKAYVWHSAVPKFEWLKYRGLESSIGSPMVEITSGDIR